MAFNRDKALKEAEKLVAKGKDREAIAVFQEIVKNDSRDLNSLNKIGDLYLKLGDKSAAVDSFAEVAEKYAADGFNLRAIAMYKKCTRSDPSRIQFVERLAELNAQQGLANEAKANWTQVAEHHLREGRTQKAREVYAKIAEIEPDNLKNRLRLADLYLKDNQLNLALGEYQIIGSELAKKGMLDESLQVLEKALGLDARNVQILRAIARTRAEMGRADEAVAFVRGKLQERGSDPDLLVVYGETLQAAGQFDAARDALNRAVAAAPGRTDIRLALHRLSLELGDADTALNEYAAVIDDLLAEGKGKQVVEDLRAILRVKEAHVPTLQRLLDVHVKLGADAKLQSDWMSKLSEAYIAQGSYADAEGVLARLVVLESDVSQHGEKLEFVRSKLRGGMGEAAAAVEMEIEAPAGDMSFGSLDTAESSGFSMSFEEGELEPEATRADDRSEFVSERLAEADVFIKYGLVDKAVEQLQAIVGRYPDDLPTRHKLRGLLLEEGKRSEALEQCLAIASVLRQQGDQVGEAEALAQAREIAPNHPALLRAESHLGAVGATAGSGGGFAMGGGEPAASGFELSFEPETPSSEAAGFDVAMEEEPPSIPSGMGASMGAGTGSGAAEFELSLEPEVPAAGGFELSFDEPSSAASADFGEGSLGTSSDVATAPVSTPRAPEPAEEAEFEISMDADESSEPQFEVDLGGAGEEAASVEEPVAPAEEPATFDFAMSSDDAAVEETPALEPEPQEEVVAPAPAIAMTEPTPIEPAAVEGESEEGLFSEEDDFFDFAEEINKEMQDELDAEEALTEVSREQDQMMSLEQIVSGIQKGVAAQVDKEDYETHYNLGIAYKEMGLHDEAIGEFQYASKDQGKFLSCCILLGACFTEKGMPELAIKWYEKGLGGPNLTEEDRVALQYEVALCREALGDDESALRDFMEIYSMNARYRDVSARVSRLKQAVGRK